MRLRCALFMLLSAFYAAPAYDATPVVIPAATTSPIVSQIQGLDISADQYSNLMLAKAVGYASFYDHVKAKEFSLLLMSIMWQESRAGKFGPVGDIGNGFGRRSYGLMQVKLDAAKRMWRRYPQLGFVYCSCQIHVIMPTEEELISALLTNPNFNVAVAAHYLKYLHDDFHLSWDKAVAAYNRGYWNAKQKHFTDKPYVPNVKTYMQDPGMQQVAASGH